MRVLSEETVSVRVITIRVAVETEVSVDTGRTHLFGRGTKTPQSISIGEGKDARRIWLGERWRNDATQEKRTEG